ncbi:DUF2786 domain-containing protein [Marinomonas agarivorans]|nr:DUF2786 domain-containing protein [Marinomonas agarivorans]
MCRANKMSTQTRKKAISKLVKLLNLSTSNNLSEAQMALRHAENLIRQHHINRSEISSSLLCDANTLNEVNWNGQGRVFSSMFYHPDSDVGNRRFSEKSNYHDTTDPNNAYANVKTILDDDFEMESDMEDPFKQAVKSNHESQAEAQRQSEALKEAQKQHEDQKLHEESIAEMEKQEARKQSDIIEESEAIDTSADEIDANEEQKNSAKTQEPIVDILEQNAEQVEKPTIAEVKNNDILTDAMIIDDVTAEHVIQLDGSIDEAELAYEDRANLKESRVFQARKPESVKAKMDAVFNNVINAANAFRPEGFTSQFRDQYAASDPSIPFEDDPYWQKVYTQLLDFDEFQVQISIDKIECQLALAQEALDKQKQLRKESEQEELNERSEKARIELSFEEAIERAFKARAKAYKQWEKERAEIRMAHLKSEQEAALTYDNLADELQKHHEDFQLHLKRKQDYQAAKVMHDLRSHLAQAVNSSDEGQGSFDKVVNIMSDAGLSLKDLEFSDIKNKSLFIRLLERETAMIEDVTERERHTEDMLSKFLSASIIQRESAKSENPLQLVEKLLGKASSSTQFEARKNLEQVFQIMLSNGISIRDINLAKITKYSVFVRLLNWEAEQISSINEREAFTASILEEYVKSSIGGETSAEDISQQNKA